MSDEDLCGAQLGYKDEKCDKPAKHMDGRCGFHTSVNDDEEDGRSDGNNTKHGLHKNRGEYYNSLPDRDQKWVDAVADDLIGKSNFVKDDFAEFEKCRQIAIDLHQRRRADGYIANTDMVQENTVGFHEQYGELTEKQENVLFITKDRLSRESRLAMKDLGVLDEDNQKSEEAAQSLIETLSDGME